MFATVFSAGSARGVLRGLAAAAILSALVAGCGGPPPSPGAAPGQTARHDRVMLDMAVSDEIVVLWNDGWTSRTGPGARTGWDAQRLAETMTSELLRDAGASLVDPDDAGAVKLVVRQAAVDPYGRVYNPARDFLAMGLVGLAVGAARREEQFQPKFSLSVHSGTGLTLNGPSRCTVGLFGELVDGATGATLARKDVVIGQEMITSELTSREWASMTPAERSIVREHCLSALRRGLGQLLTGLNVVG